MRPAPRQTRAAERILLVGTGYEDRDEVVRTVEQHGGCVSTVAAGQEAVATLREGGPRSSSSTPPPPARTATPYAAGSRPRRSCRM